MLRVRLDPASSSDPTDLLKDHVYNWFMKGNREEREYHLDSKTQIEETMNL